MKKLLLLALGLFLFAIPSHAQSADASIGYSYLRLGGSNGINQNGVSGSVSYLPKEWFGLVGDFGYYHASPSGVSVNTATYLFGPRLILHNPTKINPFVQGLVGGSRLSISGISNSQLSYSFGGGVDIGFAPHLALRPQVDYVGLNTPGSVTNCTRVSLSLALQF